MILHPFKDFNKDLFLKLAGLSGVANVTSISKWLLLKYFFCFSVNSTMSHAEADLGLLQHSRWSVCDNSYRLPAVNYYQKALHLECCSSPRSASDMAILSKNSIQYHHINQALREMILVLTSFFQSRMKYINLW